MKAILMPSLTGHKQSILNKASIEEVKHAAIDKIHECYTFRDLIGVLYSLLVATLLKSNMDLAEESPLVVEVDDSLAPEGMIKVI